MLSDVVMDLWRWLRRDHRGVVRRETRELAGVAADGPAPAVAIEVAAAEVSPPRTSPFWTASGVHGILNARRPCLVAEVLTGTAEPVVLPVSPQPVAMLGAATDAVAPQSIGPAIIAPDVEPRAAPLPLAKRLRQVGEANRPVRTVPARKRQSSDVLSKVAAATPATAVRSTVVATPLPEDLPAQIIRPRLTLIRAA
jgi:hypothetical protein